MYLSPEEIADAITSHAAMRRGRLMFLERQASKAPFSSAQVQLLRHLLALPQPQRGQYRHPEDDARHRLIPRKFGSSAGSAGRNAGGGDGQPLTDSDRAWLSTLPAPESVSYEDAVELARLAASVPVKSGDERLINSKWLPVKARHDRARANADLEAARQPLPDIDRATAEQALRDAIAATTTELDAEEQSHRAARIFSELAEARRGSREQAHNAAVQRVRDLEDAEVERRALNRPVDAVA